jgi:hypothetical protein
MAKVAILTPDPSDEGFRTRWREVFKELAGPLRERGLAVEGPAWTEPALRADLVLPLLAWGYHRAGARWTAATKEWEEQGLNIRNYPEILRWNADKSYLGRLAGLGAPVAPTRFVERLTRAELDAAAEAFSTGQLIAKPLVSASAWRTIRWSPGGGLEGGPDGPAIIQPYLPDIEKGGEISLIYLSGRFSHAIRKRPQPGDFRVQPEYDGIISAYSPEPDERRAAEACLAAAGGPLLYARVDLVRNLDRQPVLMELELVEPDLYLGFDRAAPEAFAAAIIDALVAPGELAVDKVESAGPGPAERLGL